MLDDIDIKLGVTNPENSPMRRARRVIETKIAEIEQELQTWKFVRDVLDYELEK